MSERSVKQEHHNAHPEKPIIQDVIHEKPERHKTHAERQAAKHEMITAARADAHQEALTTTETYALSEEKTIDQPSPQSFSAQEKNRVYQVTLSQTQTQLPKSLQPVSKFIHLPLLERSSDALSKTAARPSALIGASFVAVIGLGVFSIVAQFTGFQLSGSEQLLFLAGGWTFGVATSLVLRR